MRLPKLKTFWNKSQTKAWSYLQLAGSGILASVSSISHTISDPTFKSYLDQFDLPKSIIVCLALFGLASFIFHGHDDA